MPDLKLEMDHSVLSFSHKMKVFHIDLMSNLDITKANGPDDISARMLKETALSITSTPIMTHLFNISITLGELPDEWKMARVSHIRSSGTVQQCLLQQLLLYDLII